MAIIHTGPASGAISFGQTSVSTTAGPIFLAGTESIKVTSSVAGTKFLQYYLESSATSGDIRGLYLRTYYTGIAGGGDCARIYADVSVAAANVFGAHISAGFGESTTAGTVSGLGVAVRGTLGLPSAAIGGGTYAAMMPEIFSFGESCDPSGMTELSFIRCVDGGGTAGKAAIDDKAYLLVIDGVEEGAGNMVVSSATETNYASAARCKINGVEKWLMFASASG